MAGFFDRMKPRCDHNWQQLMLGVLLVCSTKRVQNAGHPTPQIVVRQQIDNALILVCYLFFLEWWALMAVAPYVALPRPTVFGHAAFVHLQVAHASPSKSGMALFYSNMLSFPSPSMNCLH